MFELEIEISIGVPRTGFARIVSSLFDQYVIIAIFSVMQFVGYYWRYVFSKLTNRTALKRKKNRNMKIWRLFFSLYCVHFTCANCYYYWTEFIICLCSCTNLHCMWKSNRFRAKMKWLYQSVTHTHTNHVWEWQIAIHNLWLVIVTICDQPSDFGWNDDMCFHIMLFCVVIWLILSICLMCCYVFRLQFRSKIRSMKLCHWLLKKFLNSSNRLIQTQLHQKI